MMPIELYEFQRQDIEKLSNVPNALIGNDMGTLPGKQWKD